MATLVVNTGKAIITSALKLTATEPKYAGWGTGAGTTAATDTTLFTEANIAGGALGANPHAGGAGTTSQVTTTTANDTYQAVATLTTTGGSYPITITNAGLWDAATAGNLFLKGDFTGIALSSGDGIQFTFKAQLT